MKKPFIISLSGVDGSGKSHQAQIINKVLLKKGFRSKIVHIGPGPKIFSSAKNISRHFIFGYLTFWKDAFQILISLAFYFRYDFIIFDRYLYDTLIKITHRQREKNIPQKLIRTTKIVPQPDLSFLFQASPKITFERDQDHSRQYHRQKLALYQQLTKYFPFHLINTDLPEKKVSFLVKEKVKLSLVDN